MFGNDVYYLCENKLKISQIAEFVLEKFEEIKQNPSLNKITKFHSFHRYLLMSFSKEQQHKLASIITNSKNSSVRKITNDYKKHLEIALSKTPTIANHVIVLQKIHRHFYRKLPKSHQKIIKIHISEYRREKIQLSDVLDTLKALTSEVDNMYAPRQSYFLLFSSRKSLWKEVV